MKKYRVKIVTTRFKTYYYPQYRCCIIWWNFEELSYGSRVDVFFTSLEEAEQFLADEKELDEKPKETVTYKYMED